LSPFISDERGIIELLLEGQMEQKRMRTKQYDRQECARGQAGWPDLTPGERLLVYIELDTQWSGLQK